MSFSLSLWPFWSPIFLLTRIFFHIRLRAYVDGSHFSGYFLMWLLPCVNVTCSLDLSFSLANFFPTWHPYLFSAGLSTRERFNHRTTRALFSISRPSTSELERLPDLPEPHFISFYRLVYSCSRCCCRRSRDIESFQRWKGERTPVDIQNKINKYQFSSYTVTYTVIIREEKKGLWYFWLHYDMLDVGKVFKARARFRKLIYL